MSIETRRPQLGDVEGQDFEFKRTYAIDGKSAVAIEMAKDVAAMASSGGGVIWLGVNEDPKRREVSGYAPVSQDELNRIQDTMAQAIKNRCIPPPKYGFHKEPKDGGFIWAVVVEPTSFPVAVRVTDGEKTSYMFPYRSGAQTQYRLPDLADHAHARKFALQLRNIPIGERVAVGETKAGQYRDGAARIMEMREVDLESLTLTLNYPGEVNETVIMRCKDILKVWDLGASGGRPRWEVDFLDGR